MDERLRELERAAAGGDVDARARLLSERLKAGDLALERVRLAAFLEDPGAVAALAERAPPGVPRLELWARRLGSWGFDVMARAGLAVVERMLTERPELDMLDPEGMAYVRAGLGEFRAGWPDPEGRLRKRAAHFYDLGNRLNVQATTAPDERSRRAFRALRTLFHLIYSVVRGNNSYPESVRLELATLTGEASAAGLDERTIRATVAAALVPWALGKEDPAPGRA